MSGLCWGSSVQVCSPRAIPSGQKVFSAKCSAYVNPSSNLSRFQTGYVLATEQSEANAVFSKAMSKNGGTLLHSFHSFQECKNPNSEIIGQLLSLTQNSENSENSPPPILWT